MEYQWEQRGCSVPNGNGTISCWPTNEYSYFWTECRAESCHAGYKLNGIACVPDGGAPANPAPNAPQKGTEDSDEELGAKKGAEILRTGSKSDGGQVSSLQDANEISRMGSNYTATIGAVYCAEGANSALADPSLGARALASCQERFASAQAMNQAFGRKGFAVDASVVDHVNTQSVLEKFEKNFGVSGGDYLRHMLGAHGSRSFFDNLVGEKIGQDKLEQAWEQAKDVKVDKEKFAMPDPKPRRLAEAAKPTLRDNLKQVLSEAEPPVSDEMPVLAKAEPVDMGRIAPLSSRELFGNNEPNGAELSLFDVVRRKYMEIAQRQKLYRYR